MAHIQENSFTPTGTSARNLPEKPLFASLALAAFTLLAISPLQAQNGKQEGDPPERVARLSIVQGNVSLQPAGVNQFSQAEANYPLTTGDRVYVDNTSRAELQSDELAIRMGAGADLTLTGMTHQVAQLGLAQGSIHIRSWNLPQGCVVEIDTPNGTITILRPGDVRVDSYPQNDTTVLTVLSGEAEATGPNISQRLGSGQSLRLTGSNPIYAERIQPSPGDDFDRFDQDRDRHQLSSRSRQQHYANPAMIGVGDLDDYGDWAPQSEYGQVWYPRNVDARWTPYHNGHWAWVAPWGWTWIEAEPWGFAPFHYGRWASFGGRWGWVPGPPQEVFGGPVRCVYSPALVAFVGGPSFSISVGFGGGGGLTAWFPLGPRETYVPWYHASPGYVNRVNVTNIYNRNTTEVRNVYNNRTTNNYVNNTINNTTINKITYVNRNAATTAIPQRAFATGRPVAAAEVHVDQRQLSQAPVMPHPMITPARQIMTTAPARAVPNNIARPVLQTRVGLAQAVPGAQASPVPVHPLNAQQQQAGRLQQPAQSAQSSLNVRQSNQPPQASRPSSPAPAQQPGAAQRFPQNSSAPIQQQAPVDRLSRPDRLSPVDTRNGRANLPAQPATQAPTPYPAPAQTQPVLQNRSQAPTQNPAQYLPQHNQPRPQPRPADQPRPLINRSEPPPSKPSFIQQQRAIQRTDPGRPLGPRQADNIRNGLPAGPHQQAEPIAHPTAPSPPRQAPSLQARPQPPQQRAQPAQPQNDHPRNQ